MSVGKNITLSSLKDFEKNFVLQKSSEEKVIEEQVKNLRIKVARTTMPVKALSGGNQQKVVLAKWMITKPEVLIFDEPTRGIDVGAKAEIYKIMCEYAAQGNAIIMVSSEMPEAMGMSDRIIVLSNHKMSGEVARDEFDEEKLAQLQFRFMNATE
ncbi:MAG: ATP-binding cassette domain-containing protein [Lachnospiraceae bacterium]|nr:ATP-binding cassette domain-containing protein [Lachnospiraceae bacterium]